MKIFKYLVQWLLISFCLTANAVQLLNPIQYFNTTGARELTPFTLNDEHYLAVAQLAADIPNTSANMNGGDADVDVVILKKINEKYVEHQRIPGHGNEGATFFTMGKDSFLAIASIQSGPHAPFNQHTYSMLYRWDGHYFYPIQQFYTYAAKQWYYFTLGERHFLAVANGVITPNARKPEQKNNSMIYEWNGKQFTPFQTIPSSWGSSFKFFTIESTPYLAFADNIKQSSLYRWDGKQFIVHQQFKGDGGRAFEFFSIESKYYLAYANIKSNSVIYQWDGKKFTQYQVLDGAGGRNFASFSLDSEHYLFRVNFITGGREKPNTALQSPLYKWQNGQFVIVQNIPTFGGVSAHVFTIDGLLYLTLANSLSKDIRFKVKSVLYEITRGLSIEFG